MVLRNKVVILTGAAGGLGRSIALALAHEGATIVAIDISAEGLQQVQRSVEATGGSCISLPFDLSRLEALPDLIAQIDQNVGRIDVLINNAGISRSGAFQDCSLTDIQAVLNVNLLASMELARLLIPRFIDQNSGHILSIASLAGKKGLAYDAIYSTSKAGLLLWSDALRQELAGTNIGVSAVCPAFIADVGMWDHSGTGQGTPSLLGSCEVSRVVQGIIQSINHSQAEVVICRGPIAEAITKITFAINQLFPRFGDFISRALDVQELNKQNAQAKIASS